MTAAERVPGAASVGTARGDRTSAASAAPTGVDASPVEGLATPTSQPMAARLSRGAVARAEAAAAPAPPLAAVKPAQAINTAVVGWFDSASAWLATQPQGPLNELVSGALLMVRRSLFNQLPTADPYRFSVKANGQLVGTLGVVDAEGDALTYSLSKVPQLGTVQIAPDGIWTYTPGPDFADGAPESFTVAVTTGGFNIFNPGAGPLEVIVPIGSATQPYYELFIQNVSTSAVGYTRLSEQAKRQPPQGYQIQPGEQVEISDFGTFAGALGIGLSRTNAASPTETDTWTIDWCVSCIPDNSALAVQQLFVDAACGETSGNASCAKSQTDGRRALIGDAEGPYDYSPDTPGAADVLAKLSQMADNYVDGLTVQYLNAVYQEQSPEATGWEKSLALDNPSDNSRSSGTKTITATTSLTEGSSWKVGGGIKFSPIEKVLELAVSAEYSKSVSDTQTKTFTTQISQALPAWSANVVLIAPPKLLATGDAVFSFPGLGTTYRFHNMDFLLPSQTQDVPQYEIRTEPLQPKDSAGNPRPGEGFLIKDKNSPMLSPTYAVGQTSQLTVTAFNGFGSDSADYTLRATYESSDPSVATVDKTGALTALAPGSATITARYDWTLPLGGGNTRKDHVIALMAVTVAG